MVEGLDRLVDMVHRPHAVPVVIVVAHRHQDVSVFQDRGFVDFDFGLDGLAGLAGLPSLPFTDDKQGGDESGPDDDPARTERLDDCHGDVPGEHNSEALSQ